MKVYNKLKMTQCGNAIYTPLEKKMSDSSVEKSLFITKRFIKQLFNTCLQ